MGTVPFRAESLFGPFQPESCFSDGGLPINGSLPVSLQGHSPEIQGNIEG